MTIAPAEHDAPQLTADPIELLIKEARLRTRKRRRRVGLAILLVAIGSMLVWALSGGVNGPSLPLRVTGGNPSGSAPALSNSLVGDVVSRSRIACGASDMVASGSHLWIVGCTFKTASMYSARVESVVELNASNGSLVRVIKAPADGFDYPNYIAVGSRNIWVANDNNTVTELNASNGTLVRVLNAKADGFNAIAGIAVYGSHVWVSDANSDSLTELNANSGSLVRVVRLSSGTVAGTNGIAVYGSHLWLSNGSESGNSVIELNASNGSLMRVIKGAQYGFNEPADVAVRGSRVWVTSGWGAPYTTPQASTQPNRYGGSVTELNANSGTVVHVIKSNADDFYGSAGVALVGSRVWIANSYGNTLTELNASNGSLVRVIKTNRNNYSGGPSVIVVSGSHLWALDRSFLLSAQSDLWGSSLTELNASNGSAVRTIK